MDVKKFEEKYAGLPHAVMVSNTDGVIVYSNDMAKKLFKSTKKKANIAFMIDNPELSALKNITVTGKMQAMNFKLAPSTAAESEQTGGLAIPENIDGMDYITFIFIPPFGLTGGISDYELEIKSILDFYTNEKALCISDTLFSGRDAELKNIYESFKKIARIDRYINFCIQDLLEEDNLNAAAQLRDITADLKLIKEYYDKYIAAQGYKIRYIFDDNMFYFEYKGWDFLVVNAIGVSFALRNSADKRIDYIFKTDSTGTSNIEISFTPPEKIFDFFTKNMSMNIANAVNADVNYFDLYLAYTVAAKNKINFYLSSEDKKIKFILEIKKEQNFGSDALTRSQSNYLSELKNYGKQLSEFLMADFLGG